MIVYFITISEHLILPELSVLFADKFFFSSLQLFHYMLLIYIYPEVIFQFTGFLNVHFHNVEDFLLLFIFIFFSSPFSTNMVTREMEAYTGSCALPWYDFSTNFCLPMFDYMWHTHMLRVYRWRGMLPFLTINYILYTIQRDLSFSEK